MRLNSPTTLEWSHRRKASAEPIASDPTLTLFFYSGVDKRNTIQLIDKRIFDFNSFTPDPAGRVHVPNTF